MTNLNCSSCKASTTNDKAATRFPCPQCAGAEIVRCQDCRKNAVAYVCPKCEFRGPN